MAVHCLFAYFVYLPKSTWVILNHIPYIFISWRKLHLIFPIFDMCLVRAVSVGNIFLQVSQQKGVYLECADFMCLNHPAWLFDFLPHSGHFVMYLTFGSILHPDHPFVCMCLLMLFFDENPFLHNSQEKYLLPVWVKLSICFLSIFKLGKILLQSRQTRLLSSFSVCTFMCSNKTLVLWKIRSQTLHIFLCSFLMWVFRLPQRG